jgi:hypothetical protein
MTEPLDLPDDVMFDFVCQCCSRRYQIQYGNLRRLARALQLAYGDDGSAWINLKRTPPDINLASALSDSDIEVLAHAVVVAGRPSRSPD